MMVNRMALRKCAAALIVTLSLSAPLFAQETTAPALPLIHIDNFGRVSDTYYRGAQPDVRGFADLAKFGVKTVIDLTADGRADERAIVENAGMRFYRIPLTTSDRPSGAAVIRFLKLVSDPASQPVYVHCQGGRHRTGVMTAVYRMTHDSWTADQAYGEMKQYRFEGFPGHPILKGFVFDYYAQLARPKIGDGGHVTEGVVSK
jgi:protein tyrosine/serine phosphatase